MLNAFQDGLSKAGEGGRVGYIWCAEFKGKSEITWFLSSHAFHRADEVAPCVEQACEAGVEPGKLQ